MPASKHSKSSRLEAYRAKRSAAATPEPFGAGDVERPGLFVVQQHAARRLHYDFRLEVGGVLRSWAVPKGPSLDPGDKRLAVATEDHPVEYGDFEGIIPEGNYGAGAVIVWDRGPTLHHLDPAAGIEEGKLLFELKGYKLRGLWTLVRTKRNPKEWLLIKKPDAAATGETVEAMEPGSVFSGLTVAELADGHGRAAEIRAELERAGVRRRRLDPAKLKPMLAKLAPEPFSKPGWLFELKYDGYRVLAARDAGARGGSPRGGRRRPGSRKSRARGARLFYRSGLEATHVFPELVRSLAALPYDSLVLDGEVVVLDDEGRPSFQRLQQRALLTRRIDVERASVTQPAVLFAFDLLGVEDFDLRALPLTRRKELLARVLPGAGPLRFADHVEERGEAFYEEVRKLGLEGMLAKRADSPYRSRRSEDWIKVRAEHTGDFAVVGFTRPKGTRSGFGALHLAVRDGDRWLYSGRAGTGFSDKQLVEIREKLDKLRRKTPPVEAAEGGELPSGREHLWVEPELVAEVRYIEYTEAGNLRHPVFVRLREDKPPEECLRADRPREAPAAPALAEERPPFEVLRPEKVFWPREGYTKGDLAAFYQTVAPWLLPYLEDRPLVLDRYPDGIEGKSFFQKNAPDFTPDWVRTESVWSEDSEKETRYFVVDDVEMLLYLVNSAAIPLHVWSSRLPSLQNPDWCILDLDAKQTTFANAIKVARAIRKLCREIGLDCFVKTSGATGLHVLLPLGGHCTHRQSRQLAEVLAKVVCAENREIATIARTVAKREDQIYVDFLQNGYGKLLVSPFSVRPVPGATVSTPLRWSEVKKGLEPGAFTIKTVPQRLARMKKDPWQGLLGTEPDLTRALAGLLERL